MLLSLLHVSILEGNSREETGTEVQTGRAIGHSTRSVSTTKGRNKGMTTSEIMKAAGWKTESIFERFYYVPEFSADFTKKVLEDI